MRPEHIPKRPKPFRRELNGHDSLHRANRSDVSVQPSVPSSPPVSQVSAAVPNNQASANQLVEPPNNIQPPKPSKQFNNGKRVGAWLAVATGLLLIVVVAGVSWYWRQLTPKTSYNVYHVIKIEPGSSTAQIAHKLQEGQVIRSAKAFIFYVKMNKVSSLQAGDYRLSSKQKVKDIVDTLASGRVTSTDVLILPGQTILQIEAKLKLAGFEEEDIKQGLIDVKKHPLVAGLPAGTSLEGYLFPDTYKIGPDTKAKDLFWLMLDNFEQKITPQIKNNLRKNGLSLRQGIILASIVQKEDSRASVQPTIAQVFIKRYKQGMMLGSDVTALYGAIHDGLQLPKNAVQAANIAINHDSPFNTRIHSGLPPGPIANFNLSSLQAVAYPSHTDYLYFFAGDDKKVYFSRTSEEHEEMVEKHCKIAC